MLQQTKVETVIPYFDRFLSVFPTVENLAAASRHDVMMLWEGLGYYSRARNLHAAAKIISSKYSGNIPDNRDDILSLPGIGPYTAAAVLSIAYNKPHAVVDGNVIRVLSRYAGIEGDIRVSSTAREIETLANELLDTEIPGDYNQALMELGSILCKPRSPECLICPLQAGCVAFQTARTRELPYKSPKKTVPHYLIGIGIIENEAGELLIALRPDHAMLGGLWEFPGGKNRDGETIEETIRRELKEELGVEVVVERFLKQLDHTYSHFKVTLHAYMCRITKGIPRPVSSSQILWVKRNRLDRYPFPRANRLITRALMSEGGL
jgi:A/G-specific adenine glycosylase